MFICKTDMTFVLFYFPDNTCSKMDKGSVALSEPKPEHLAVRQNFKSRLDRLGNLYSGNNFCTGNGLYQIMTSPVFLLNCL